MPSCITTDGLTPMPFALTGGVTTAEFVGMGERSNRVSADPGADFLSALLAYLPTQATNPMPQVTARVPNRVTGSAGGHARPDADAPDRSAPGRPLGRAPEGAGADANPQPAEESDSEAAAVVMCTVSLIPMAPVVTVVPVDATVGATAVPTDAVGATVMPIGATVGATAVSTGAVDATVMPIGATVSATVSPTDAVDATAAFDNAAVAESAPPAGLDPSPAAPARPGMTGPLLPPPARAESAILSARAPLSETAAPAAQTGVAGTESADAPANPAVGEVEGGVAEVAPRLAEEARPQPLPPEPADERFVALKTAAAADEAPSLESVRPEIVVAARPAPDARMIQQNVEVVRVDAPAAPPVQRDANAPAVALPQTEPSAVDQPRLPAVDAKIGTTAVQPAPNPEGRDGGTLAFLPEQRPREERAGRDRSEPVDPGSRVTADAMPMPDRAARNETVAVAATRTHEVEHLPPRAELLSQIEAGTLKAVQLSRVTVQLHPPNLGSVAIAVESRQGQLHAHFHTTHPLMNSWLESNAPALRSQLADAGLVLHDLSLSTSFQGHGSYQQMAPGDEIMSMNERTASAAIPAAMASHIGSDHSVDYFA